MTAWRQHSNCGMEFKQTAKACQSNAFILQLVAASAATPIAYHHCQSACYDHEQRIRPDIQSAHARRTKVDVRHVRHVWTGSRVANSPVTFAQKSVTLRSEPREPGHASQTSYSHEPSRRAKCRDRRMAHVFVTVKIDVRLTSDASMLTLDTSKDPRVE